MDSRTSSKIFFSTSQSSFPSPMASLASGHLESMLKYPFSAGSGHIARLPSCINHKRKKSSYVVTVTEGEPIYFCQRCMQTASKQGFEGFKIKEFYGTPNSCLLNQPSKEKDKTNRNCILNQYLDNLKLVFQQIGNFRQKIGSALIPNSNSNYIEVLFQRLETQIQRLKHCYRREASVRDHQQSKDYQQMMCRAVWNEEDLQHMISRICKNYDKLTKEPSETFNINLKLMNNSLQEKKNTLAAIQNQFSRWRKDSLRSFEVLQDNFYQRLQRVWEECLLDCSISKISQREETGRDSSTQFCKIVQELSTTHTLA